MTGLLLGATLWLALQTAPAPKPVAPAPGPAAVETVFVDGNYVGMRFGALGTRTIARADNITLLCVDGIDRARRRLRASGAPLTDPDNQGFFIEGAAAAQMADHLDALMDTRRAEIEELGVQMTYNQKRKRARVKALCEGGLFEALGLKRDDIIVRVGDRPIAGRESAAVVLKYLDETPAPEIVVLRGDASLTLPTTGHERAVRALLVVMSRTLAMVPDPMDPALPRVAPSTAP